MNTKRLTVIILLLAAVALVFALVRFLPSSEPNYQDKPVSVWFKEYAYASNAPATRLRNLGVRTQPDGQMVLMQVAPDGRLVTRLAPTNRTAQIVWLQQQMSPPSDPSWEALQALGSNAVPHLVKQLRIGVMDRAYERAFTNLPPALQGKLPDPRQKPWLRIRAINTLAKLGDPASAASPFLLELLKQRDPSLRRAVFEALRSLHVDRRAITAVLLRLGSEGKYADVIEIAENTGWEGEEMVRLFGTILESLDPALRRSAITLLERAGPRAMPVLEQITAALKDSDPEVRYLASRSLESMRINSPQVVTALRTRLQDENVMVRNVATRTLTNIAPGTVQLERSGAAQD